MSAVKGDDNVLAALHNLHVNFNQGSKSAPDAMDVKTPLDLWRIRKKMNWIFKLKQNGKRKVITYKY